MAPFGAAVFLVAIAALLRRHRWAWWFFLLFSVLGAVQAAIGSHERTTWILGLAVVVVELGLLVSRPMRRFVAPDRGV